MTWTCKKIELFIDDFLEGKLSVQDTFTYEAHVETCPGCRKYVAQTSVLIEESRGQIAPEILARGREMPQKMRQKVSDELAGLPMEKQVLLAEAVRKSLEEDLRRRREWIQKAHSRRARAKPN